MSNVYDFNPSGVIPLQRLIQSQIPQTSVGADDPAAVEGRQPLPTPGGGLDLRDVTPTGPIMPSGLRTLFGNIGSGVADLARRYFAAGQPSVWGQGAQQVDESGMIAGAQQPPQQPQQPPDTTGAAGGAPSQMQPPRATQWPPSPSLPKPEPPASETPPAADKAPPRQDPYIPSRKDTRPNAWGRPDLAEQGSVKYPGMLPGPYMPQPHEWSGVMRGATGFLGNMGSGVVAPLARLIAGLDPAYHKARMAGDEHRARMAAANFALYSKQLAQKQALESRAYGDAFAAYGPRMENGKLNPGDEDALRDAITKIAADNHDTVIPAVLARGGIPAVERLIRERDAHGKDASKVLIQMQRRNAIILQEQRIAANRAKERAASQAQFPWLIGGGAGAGSSPAGALAPVSPGGGPAAADDEHQFDPHFGGKPEGAPAAEPEEKPSPEEVVPEGTPETTETPEAPETPETPRQTRQSEAETPQSPSDEIIQSAQTGVGATAQAPTRLAARGDGSVSDAPQPGAGPKAEPLPRTAAAAAPTSAAPAAGTPEAMGATAPVPSLQPSEPVQPGRVPMMQEIPGQAAAEPPATEGAAPAPSYEWKPPRSQALANAAATTIQTERGPMRPNPQMIDTLAQQMVNGTIKIQDLRNYPDWVKGMARARGDEIIAQMHQIAKDPNIKSKEQVYAALDKINPEFSAALKGYVSGNFGVPTSAWANPGYRNRTIELGQKADPSFNEFTAKTRAATIKDAAIGKIGQGLTFTATAYRHLHHVEELLQQRPANWASRVLANIDTPGWLDRWLGIHPEDRDIIGALQNAVNTANSEYERALVGGRPTVAGRREQSAEIPLTIGHTRTMLANIRDKQIMLRDRLDELEQQFTAGTGMQPNAMYDRFERASGLATSRRRDMDNIRSLKAGGVAPVTSGRPAGGRAAPSEDVIDYRTYFGQ